MLLHEVPASWLLLATSLWDSGIVFSRLILIFRKTEVRSSLSRRAGVKIAVVKRAETRKRESGVGPSRRSQQPCIGLRGWSYVLAVVARETLQRPPLHS
jgi:hypothetical protein